MAAVKLKVAGVPEHFNAPWHIARDRGLFAKENIELEWNDYPGGTGAMTKALNDGSTDIAVLLTEGIVKDIATGGSSKIVGVYVQSSLCWGIHTGAQQEDINSVASLQGKTWAVSRMTSGSHLMAVVLAKQQGWDVSGLEYKVVGNLDGAKQALLAGDAHGFLWEKFTTKPLVDAGHFRRVGEIPTPWPCFVIAVRNETLANHGAEVKKVLEIVAKQCAEFKADPKAVAYIAENYKLEASDVAEWFKTVEWAANPLAVDDAMLLQVGTTLKELAILEDAPDPASLKGLL